MHAWGLFKKISCKQNLNKWVKQTIEKYFLKKNNNLKVASKLVIYDDSNRDYS